MKRKPIPILVSILLIFTVLGSTLILFLTPVFATNPACGATITKTTTLTANIGPCSGNGLIITANSIILNCAGHTISATSGDTYAGITLSGVTKVTVEKCNVKGFFWGFDILGSRNTLTGNTANNNPQYGFVLISASSNTITKNTASSNGAYGFYLSSSSTNTLTGNTANNNGYGFYLSSSSSNTLTGNTAKGNTDNGFLLSDSSSNHLSKNTANDNGIGFHLSGSSGNTLTGNTANNNVDYGYYDNSVSSSPGLPHWDTGNSYGTTVAKLSTTGDKGTGNGQLAGGNSNIGTATSPF